MNIQSVDFGFRYHYFPTVWPDGTEYRYCYSTQPICNFGFAVWHERTDGRTLVTDEPQFVKSRKSAKKLVQELSEEFRKSFPHCTYHQVIVGRAEFRTSMMREEYRTLRRWVSMQGLTKADFAITPHHRFYRLSFRSMNSEVEAAISYLRLAGVLSRHGCGALISENDGRLEDLRAYKG